MMENCIYILIYLDYIYIFGGLRMSCGCSSHIIDGKDIVDHVKSKGKRKLRTSSSTQDSL